MNDNIYYDFCPKCGALMREGVCQSCEFTVKHNAVSDVPDMGMYNDSVTVSNIGIPNPVPQPPKKSKTGLIVGLIIGGVVLISVIAIVLVVGIYIAVNAVTVSEKNSNAVIKENENSFYGYDDKDEVTENDTNDFSNEIKEPIGSAGQQWSDIWDEQSPEDGRIDLDGDGIGDLEFELGEEGLNAEYYPLITDYIRYDLEYSVYFMEYSNADDSVKCVYPQLKGNKKSIAYINQFLYNFADETEEVAKNNDCSAKSDAYVTYMDENVISIVFIELYTKQDNSNFEYIYCYTFDMSGDEYKLVEFELTDTSDLFIGELQTRCLEQSTSDAEYLFGGYTKDEIRDEILASEHGLVAFYTPLGMELGLNYGGYWCCATFKDYADYIHVVEDTETGIEF